MPHDIVHRLPQNLFLAGLWMGSGLGWPERDFGVVGNLCHVGPFFEDLDTLIFMVPSDFIGCFFVPKMPYGAMCVQNALDRNICAF